MHGIMIKENELEMPSSNPGWDYISYHTNALMDK